jgi:hypothetical protein
MAAASAELIGKNVSSDWEGEVLVLRIDTAKSLGRSNSGKSELIGTTSGASKLPGGLNVNVNVYK